MVSAHKKAPPVPYMGSPWPFASKVGAFPTIFVFRFTAGQPLSGASSRLLKSKGQNSVNSRTLQG